MHAVFAILRKELRVAFTTPLFYATAAGFTFLTGILFLRRLDAFQSQVDQLRQSRPELLERLNFTDSVLAGLWIDTAVVLIFLIPFLSMRLLADERRQRTFELLKASPVRPVEIALGKFLSVLTLIAALLTFTLLYPALCAALAEVGGVAWETVWTALLGLFLLAAAFASLGLAASALTSSPIVAAFGTWCVLMVLWLIGWAAEGAAGINREVLLGLSALEHVRAFTQGVIDSRAVAYDLSWIALGFYFTVRVLPRSA